MSANRKPNGQFGANNNANPGGRPRKEKSMLDDVARELKSRITITENGKRKRVSKLAANAKQIANQGASGELRAAKMAVDYALKAEREREAPAPIQLLTSDDQAIVARFIARLKASELTREFAGEDKASNCEPTQPASWINSSEDAPDADAKP